MKLNRDEKIISVVPECCGGPGWTNQVMWVHIVDYATNKYRSECLQWGDLTDTQRILFSLGVTMISQLLNSVEIEATEAEK